MFTCALRASVRVKYAKSIHVALSFSVGVVGVQAKEGELAQAKAAAAAAQQQAAAAKVSQPPRTPVPLAHCHALGQYCTAHRPSSRHACCYAHRGPSRRPSHVR
eukprot:3297463-Rhodomonas_salina.4